MNPFRKLINYEYSKNETCLKDAFSHVIDSLVKEKDYMSIMTILQEFDYDTYEKIEMQLKASLQSEDYLTQRNKVTYEIYSEVSYGVFDIINSDLPGKAILIMDFITKTVKRNEYFVFIYFHIKSILNDRKNENLTLAVLLKEAFALSKLNPDSLSERNALIAVPIIALFSPERDKRYKSEKVNIRKATCYYEHIREFIYDDSEFVISLSKSNKFGDSINSMILNYIRLDKINNLLTN